MLQTLLESRATVVDRRRGWTVASAGLHVAIVALVAVLTLPNVRDGAATPRAIPPLVFIVPPRAAPTAASHAPSGLATSPALPTLDLPVVPRFETSVDVDRATNISAREIFGDAPLLTTSGVTSHIAGSVLTADRVNRQVMPGTGNGQPDYPEALRTSSVEGEVMARFVVDTLGRVEQSSIAIVAATHPLFAAEVRKWLLRSGYVPAHYAGQAVRQLVEQRFQFTMRR